MTMNQIPALIGTTTTYRALGTDNVGNVLHAVAARRLLQEYKEFPTSREWTPQEVERVEMHSHIVIVMANALRLGREVTSLSPHHDVMRKNIEKTTRPVVVFGLGAQAVLDKDVSYKAPESTLKLLKVISERSRRIAVRGDFTADVLRRLGINNPEVIGCQTCFMSLRPEFPFDLASKGTEAKQVAFNYTSALVEGPLIQQALQNGFDMIGQQEIYEAHAKEGIEYEANPKIQKFLKNFDISEETYKAYCRKHFHVFVDTDRWLSHMTKYDFVFGTRFHGNSFALQAGVPTLWLVHDERTRELCNHLKLPQIALADALEWKNVQRFREAADYSEFLKVYPERYRRLKSYVEDAGLLHRLA
jgi:hypothetical protein